MLSKGPHLTSPKERNNTQPLLLEVFEIIRDFENVEQRYEDDVVVMKFGFAMQHRPFPFGEGNEGQTINI